MHPTIDRILEKYWEAARMMHKEGEILPWVGSLDKALERSFSYHHYREQKKEFYPDLGGHRA